MAILANVCPAVWGHFCTRPVFCILFLLLPSFSIRLGAQCSTISNDAVSAALGASTEYDNNSAPPVDCKSTLTLHKDIKQILFTIWSQASYFALEDGATAQWQVDLTLSNGRTLFSQSGQSPAPTPSVGGQTFDVSADTHDGDVVLTLHASITPLSGSYLSGWIIEPGVYAFNCTVVGQVGNGEWSGVVTPGPAPGTSDDSSRPYTDVPINAYVPLGGLLQLKMRSDPYGFLSVSSQLTDQSVATQSIDSKALFPNNVLIPIGSNNGTTLSFLATHTGTATITLTPPSTDQLACTDIVPITINVQPPQSVGPASSVDELLIAYADRSGIPPQLIKAHAAQESGRQFNVSAYRYEPLGNYVGDYAVMSRHQDFRANRYSTYAFAAAKDSQDPNGISQGSSVSSTDLETTSLVCCSTWRQIIQNTPGANYKTLNPNSYARYFSGTTDDFTAQTSLAASYGLFQLMFESAWERGLKTNPTSLYDTSNNIPNQTNSTYFAVRAVELAFTNLYGNAPPVSSWTVFVNAFKAAWHTYNAKSTYSQNVANRISAYSPVGQQSLFGGQQ